MKTLKAKIKKTSVHYKKGTNQKGKSIWLSIVDFNPRGANNYKIKAIKSIKNGFAEYQEIWVTPDDITLKHHEDGQLKLDIFSPQEQEEIKYSPKIFNKRRFEVITENEKQYFSATDHEMLKNVLKQYNISEYKINQVSRLSKNEISDF